MPINFMAMTWNLENLFPVGNEFGPRTQAVFDAKMANLAQTILQIAPDVLAVQEIGNRDTFAHLQQQLNNQYAHAALSTRPDGRGIRVGFLSRLPLSAVEEIVQFPPEALSPVCDSQTQQASAQSDAINALRRGALKVTVAVTPHLQINVLNAHLKSKLITYSNGRRPRFSPRDENERARETGIALIVRTAEAVALRVRINQLVTNSEQPFIMMGDLNDGPEAVTTQILLGPDDLSLTRRDKFDDVRLYNLAEYIPPTHQFSRIFHKRLELIDHILVSHELIFQRRQVDSYVTPIESITENPASRRDAVFPDHAPVFARFEWL